MKAYTLVEDIVPGIELAETGGGLGITLGSSHPRDLVVLEPRPPGFNPLVKEISTQSRNVKGSKCLAFTLAGTDDDKILVHVAVAGQVTKHEGSPEIWAGRRHACGSLVVLAAGDCARLGDGQTLSIDSTGEPVLSGTPARRVQRAGKPRAGSGARDKASGSGSGSSARHGRPSPSRVPSSGSTRHESTGAEAAPATMASSAAPADERCRLADAAQSALLSLVVTDPERGPAWLVELRRVQELSRSFSAEAAPREGSAGGGDPAGGGVPGTDGSIAATVEPVTAARADQEDGPAAPVAAASAGASGDCVPYPQTAEGRLAARLAEATRADSTAVLARLLWQAERRVARQLVVLGRLVSNAGWRSMEELLDALATGRPVRASWQRQLVDMGVWPGLRRPAAAGRRAARGAGRRAAGRGARGEAERVGPGHRVRRAAPARGVQRNPRGADPLAARGDAPRARLEDAAAGLPRGAGAGGARRLQRVRGVAHAGTGRRRLVAGARARFGHCLRLASGSAPPGT